ncbi:monooxygenase [Rhexocercosporidium sp. MPI-PUGE-AT-0058]|nr:monooxygenase [Rhexocercosporidium sp. MPI-PUGE-AT-0058]
MAIQKGSNNAAQSTNGTSLEWGSFKPRRLRILMLGAGISGIQLAHDVTTRMNADDYHLEIFEKNSGVGGTWFENKYPGCACDVPAHTYMFSWEPNPDWSKFFAPAPEILAYLNTVVDKHDLRKYIKFNHRAVSAVWREESSTWKIKFQASDSAGHTYTVVQECDIFIQGVGTLNAWKYPDFPGLSNFEGSIMHTATWDDTVDLTGKSVAVIGNGASAVQVVSALQPIVKELKNYMRTASWMLPHLFSDGLVQLDYEQEFRDQLRNDPEFYRQYRARLEKTLSGGFEALWRGTSANEQLTAITTAHMKNHIQDPKMLAAMMPDFELGCRRFTPGDHYLSALQQENIELIWDPITKVEGSEIYTKNGNKAKVDVLICASGFDTTYEPRFPIIGRNGYSLAQNWGKDKACESYMGSTVAGFPNFFTFNPPICPVIGSAFPGIQMTSAYILRVVDRIQHDDIQSVCVKQEAQAMFNKWAQSRFPSMVFTGTCKSWYKNSRGKVIIPWPGTIYHFMKTTEIIRWEDYDFVFQDPEQKYSSLGNGITREKFTADIPPWFDRL